MTAAITTEPSAPPKTRGDCLPGGTNEARPCRYRRCRHHIARDVPRGRRLPLAEMRETCALDVADGAPDGLTLEEVGSVLQVTRERIRQIEAKALGKVLRAIAKQAAP